MSSELPTWLLRCRSKENKATTTCVINASNEKGQGLITEPRAEERTDKGRVCGPPDDDVEGQCVPVPEWQLRMSRTR